MKLNPVVAIVIFVIVVFCLSLLIGFTLGLVAQLIAIPFFMIVGAYFGWNLHRFI